MHQLHSSASLGREFNWREENLCMNKEVFPLPFSCWYFIIKKQQVQLQRSCPWTDFLVLFICCAVETLDISTPDHAKLFTFSPRGSIIHWLRNFQVELILPEPHSQNILKKAVQNRSRAEENRWSMMDVNK